MRLCPGVPFFVMRAKRKTNNRMEAFYIGLRKREGDVYLLLSYSPRPGLWPLFFFLLVRSGLDTKNTIPRITTTITTITTITSVSS